MMKPLLVKVVVGLFFAVVIGSVVANPQPVPPTLYLETPPTEIEALLALLPLDVGGSLECNLSGDQSNEDICSIIGIHGENWTTIDPIRPCGCHIHYRNGGPYWRVFSEPPSCHAPGGESCIQSARECFGRWRKITCDNDKDIRSWDDDDTVKNRGKHIVKLELMNMRLNGSVPAEVFSGLSHLTELNMSLNILTADLPEIPPGSLPNLTKLDLSYNKLRGGIPPSFSAMTNLKWLDLSNNQLRGSIPASLSVLTNLEWLDLSSNQLRESIPASLSALTNLVWLDLSSNQLRESIPASLSALTKLKTLRLGLNQLTGSIPASFVSLTGVTDLDLKASNSKLDATAFNCNAVSRIFQGLTYKCAEPAQKAALVALHAATGGPNWNVKWPTDLVNTDPCDDKSASWEGVECDKQNDGFVVKLNLPENNLTGAFPASSLSLLTRLTELDLSENYLTGTVAPTLFPSISRLSDLRVQTNELEGSIPDLSALTDLVHLDLSENDFDGSVPASLVALTKLAKLFLDTNNLTGTVPDFSTMAALEVLTLEDNGKLTGCPVTDTAKNKEWFGNVCVTNTTKTPPNNAAPVAAPTAAVTAPTAVAAISAAQQTGIGAAAATLFFALLAAHTYYMRHVALAIKYTSMAKVLCLLRVSLSPTAAARRSGRPHARRDAKY